MKIKVRIDTFHGVRSSLIAYWVLIPKVAVDTQNRRFDSNRIGINYWNKWNKPGTLRATLHHLWKREGAKVYFF